MPPADARCAPPLLRDPLLLATALYSGYARAVSCGDALAWAGYFTRDCHYEVVTAGNVEEGWSQPVLLCEGRGMVDDRARAVSDVMVTPPARIRLVVAGVTVTAAEDDRISGRSVITAYRVPAGEPPELFATGETTDVIVPAGPGDDAEEGALLFSSRQVILDSAVIKTALIMPL
jgi:anthranilate 1,2-dioxygenase small subunit